MPAWLCATPVPNAAPENGASTVSNCDGFDVGVGAGMPCLRLR